MTEQSELRLRVLRVSLEFLLLFLSAPGERWRVYTITQDALPTDARLAGHRFRPGPAGVIEDNVVELLIESRAWSAEEASQPLSPVVHLSFINHEEPAV